MYRHILVAVDGSETSNLALKEAIKLAKEQQAALRLIHVVDLTPAYMIVEAPYPFREYQETLRKAGEKELADSAAMIRDKEIVFDTKLSVVETITLRICDLINEEAKRWPADLIVIRHPRPTRIQSFSSR